MNRFSTDSSLRSITDLRRALFFPSHWTARWPVGTTDFAAGTRRRAGSRLRYSDISVLAALSGLASMIALPTLVRVVLLAVLLFFGPGAAILSWVRIPRTAVPAALPILSISVVTLMVSVAMWGYRWSPRMWTLLLCLALIASSVLWYRKHGLPDREGWIARTREVVSPASRKATLASIRFVLTDRRTLRHNVAGLVLALAFFLWLPMLPGLERATYSQFGLLTAGTGPGLVLCMVLIIAAFLIALRRHQLRTMVVAIGLAIVVQRFTVTLVTSAPIYDWTYKHVAVTEYILDLHKLAPSGVDIYSEWPSFFLVSAWFQHVTGYDTLSLAHVFAPMVHVVLGASIYGLARVMKFTKRAAITAAMLAEVINWVGQDYYSPQAWAMLLAVGFLALLMSSPLTRAAAYVSIVPFAALVPTHQLTPYWLMAVTGVLLVTRRAKPWWLMIPLGIILLGYLYPRLPIVAPYGLFQGFDPVQNAASNVQEEGVLGKQITSLVCRALSGGVFALAFVSAIYAWRTKKTFWAPMVMAFGSIMLLAGQSYGGEAIFRVYLYAIPGCVLLITPLFLTLFDREPSQVRSSRAARVTARTSVAVATAGALGSAVLGLQAYFGLWPIVLEHRSQIDDARAAAAQSPSGTSVTMLYSSGYPARSTSDYGRLTEANQYWDVPLYALGPEYMEGFPTPEKLGEIDYNASISGTPTFMVLTRQSLQAMHYYGFVPDDAVNRFRQWLATSPAWSLRYHDPDTIVYQYRSR
ncbi:hypothetical protein [Rhodococcus sp. KRD162]|uniref:hypothetical protein n=1 Tax=Rhodococcus sp. KRD162 TaxID=2729725 RepID=UPI0019D2F83F|nr:hypothetical protein [Rhodococcus sp. KRD162]